MRATTTLLGMGAFMGDLYRQVGYVYHSSRLFFALLSLRRPLPLKTSCAHVGGSRAHRTQRRNLMAASQLVWLILGILRTEIVDPSVLVRRNYMGKLSSDQVSGEATPAQPFLGVWIGWNAVEIDV